MAKFGAYYGLCPLIDNKSLLGITKDVEKGNVIVTLGKNIAIKYKLSDQKQICSWRTKEKFTSPIVYDYSLEKYMAVFNQSYLRTWSSDEDEHLDKLKKFKFNKQIYTILSVNYTNFIIFQNGAVCNLQHALNERKLLDSKDIIDEGSRINDVISSSLNGEYYIGLVAKKGNEYYLYWTKIGTESKGETKFSKIFISRGNDVIFRGCTFHNDAYRVNFITMWSDGRLYCNPLQIDPKQQSIGELFAGIETICTKNEVKIVALSPNYLALYGANTNEEGAVLIIYNTQFKVTQSKQPFKLFTSGAKLICLDSNLFLPVGQNLAVIPFNLDTEQLATLVGSHKVLENDPDISIVEELEIADWTPGKIEFKIKDKYPEDLKIKIEEFVKRGLPENLIFDAILHEIIDENNINLLNLCLLHFIDISEKSLAKVLNYLLTVDKNHLKPVENSTKKYPKAMQPSQRGTLIDLVLKKSFSDILLLPYIRSEINLKQVLVLIQYICFMFSDNGHCLPTFDVTRTHLKLIEWSCVLIDSNYQKFLLSSDERVLELLKRLEDITKSEVDALEELKEVYPMILQLAQGKNLVQSNILKHGYSIEKLSLV